MLRDDFADAFVALVNFVLAGKGLTETQKLITASHKKQWQILSQIHEYCTSGAQEIAIKLNVSAMLSLRMAFIALLEMSDGEDIDICGLIFEYKHIIMPIKMLNDISFGYVFNVKIEKYINIQISNTKVAFNVLNEIVNGVTLCFDHHEIIGSYSAVKIIKSLLNKNTNKNSGFYIDPDLTGIHALRGAAVVCLLRMKEHNLFEKHLGCTFHEFANFIHEIDDLVANH